MIASRSAAVVDGEPTQDRPAGGLDIRIPWLDQRFPPGSRARLVLMLIATPVIGGLVELYGRVRGEPMSLGRWIFVTIATMAVVVVGFVLHRRHAGRGPQPPPEERAEPGHGPVDASSRYRPRLRDFLVGIPIGFVGILAFEAVLMGVGDTFSPVNLAMTALGAVVLSAVIVLRYTVWSLIIVSLLLGAGGAVFVVMFSAFWGTGTGFLEAWVVCSLLAATVVAPFWFALRRAATRGGGPFPGPQGHASAWTDLPTPWLLVGSLGLMLLFAIVMRATGEL